MKKTLSLILLGASLSCQDPPRTQETPVLSDPQYSIEEIIEAYPDAEVVQGLLLNFGNGQRYIANKSLEAGYKDLESAISEEKSREEVWFFLPEYSLWIEAGRDEVVDSIGDVVVATGTHILMEEWNTIMRYTNDIIVVHTHPPIHQKVYEALLGENSNPQNGIDKESFIQILDVTPSYPRDFQGLLMHTLAALSQDPRARVRGVIFGEAGIYAHELQPAVYGSLREAVANKQSVDGLFIIPTPASAQQLLQSHVQAYESLLLEASLRIAGESQPPEILGDYLTTDFVRTQFKSRAEIK